MNAGDASWLEYQRHRFMRPDAHRYVRPDAYRFMPPGAPCYLGKEAVRYFWPEYQVDSPTQWHDCKYSPDQPRVPAGNPDGGQWTGGGAGRRATEFSSQRRRPADWHHYVPRSLYEKLPLSPEVRKVFEGSKTGPLYDVRSNRYDGSHRSYNNAVAELFERFVERNGIRPERMTSDQAHSFLREVLISSDPRIRNYNMLIQLREIMRRVFRRPLRPE